MCVRMEGCAQAAPRDSNLVGGDSCTPFRVPASFAWDSNNTSWDSRTTKETRDKQPESGANKQNWIKTKLDSNKQTRVEILSTELNFYLIWMRFLLKNSQMVL
jgi:hypothetical protein